MKYVLFVINIFFISFLPLSGSAQPGLPDTEIRTSNGQSISFRSIIDSTGTFVVCLWATWCVPCIDELDAFQEILSSFNDAPPFSLLAISTDESRTVQKVRPFVNAKGWKFSVFTESTGNLLRDLNVSSIPYLLIFQDGRLKYKKSGYLAGDEESVLRIIMSAKSDTSQ